MKKISSLLALPLLMGIALSSCVEDTQPRLQAPTEFKLNTPEMANETYIFRDDENYQNLNDITFTVSQPNYGLGVTPTYTVQIAKAESDFATWDAAMAKGDAEDANSILGSDGNPVAYTLNLATQQAVINIGGTLFCDAVNTLYGLDQDNYNHETVDVAVRVHAALPNAPQSEIWSNVINIKVSSYIPVSEPGRLYIIGDANPDGWDINSESLYIDETGIGTKVFYGNIFVPAGKFLFRFYQSLGDWESYSVGSQDADNAIDISFNSEGLYEGPVFMGIEKGDKKGKGSWKVDGWAGGNVEITVNLRDMSITMQKSQGKQIYAIGNFQGWNIDGDNCALEETPAGSNIYEGTFDVAKPADGVEFALYTKLGDWENNFLGPEDGKQEFAVAGGPYIGTIVAEKRNFKCSNWPASKIKIAVYPNSYTIPHEGI